MPADADRAGPAPDAGPARLGPAVAGVSPAVGRSLIFAVGRVRDLVKGPPVTCAGAETVAGAARLMTERAVGSLIVLAADGRAAGIVTDRDFRSKVVAAGLGSGAPVSAIMSAPVITVGRDAPTADALVEMTRRNIHHLGVEEDGRLMGVVSSHDIVLAQGAHPVALAREIEAQGAVEGLVAAAARIQPVARWLLAAGAGVGDIGRIVAELNDRLVRRAVDLADAGVAAERGRACPVAYSWIAAGSEGRREQTLSTDQDNGLVFQDAPVEAAAEAADFLAALADRVGATLERAGIPACPGGYMATRERWRQPASVWRGYFAQWMETPQPQALLHASTYFDLRVVAGSPGPGEALADWACDTARGRVPFLRLMARDAVNRRVPLGWLGGFSVDRRGPRAGRLDLKGGAIFPMTQAMRVFALSLGLRETNTLDRLDAAGARGELDATDVSGLREAYEVLGRLRLRHQLECIDRGAPPDNHVDPRGLGRTDRLLLREALRSVARLQAAVEERFQTAAVV